MSPVSNFILAFAGKSGVSIKLKLTFPSATEISLISM